MEAKDQFLCKATVNYNTDEWCQMNCWVNGDLAVTCRPGESLSQCECPKLQKKCVCEKGYSEIGKKCVKRACDGNCKTCHDWNRSSCITCDVDEGYVKEGWDKCVC